MCASAGTIEPKIEKKPKMIENLQVIANYVFDIRGAQQSWDDSFFKVPLNCFPASRSLKVNSSYRNISRCIE